MTIKLTAEIERALAKAAHSQGTTPELLALDYLRECLVSAEATPSTSTPGGQATLADYLADHIGVLASGDLVPGGARLSENTSAKFAAGLVQKRVEGRL